MERSARRAYCTMFMPLLCGSRISHFCLIVLCDGLPRPQKRAGRQNLFAPRGALSVSPSALPRSRHAQSAIISPSLHTHAKHALPTSPRALAHGLGVGYAAGIDVKHVSPRATPPPSTRAAHVESSLRNGTSEADRAMAPRCLCLSLCAFSAIFRLAFCSKHSKLYVLRKWGSSLELSHGASSMSA